MKLKTFDSRLVQTLNGIDTFTVSVVCTTPSISDRFKEGATHGVAVSGNVLFAGSIKETVSKNAGYIREIVSESPMSYARDTSIYEEIPRGLTKMSRIVASILPNGFTMTLNADEDPLIEYALRSGSVLTHLNTLCSMSGMNWRSDILTATTANISISKDGDYTEIDHVFVQNKDIFNLKIDTSLFKKYTCVTVVGVEPEVSGYTCVASITGFKLHGDTFPATFFILDSDDGEIYENEVTPPGYVYDHISNANRYRRLDLRYGANLKGWEYNSVCLVNEEFIRFESKSGMSLFGIERGYWGSAAKETHIYNDPCVLAERLFLRDSNYTMSPATNLFRIGSEVIRGELQGNSIVLATVNPSTLLYEGRGLHYVDGSGWISNSENIYSHKQGSVVTPFYPSATYLTETASHLNITLHGKGLITKDGIDKLAWGVIRNVQNGILSGSADYKSGDFYDTSISVGQKIRIETASTMTGTTNIISPATSYDVIIYSITRKQNHLMHIEFGNVVPEILQMIKSGEYALQAAIRKTKENDVYTATEVGISGACVSYGNGKVARIRW